MRPIDADEMLKRLMHLRDMKGPNFTMDSNVLEHFVRTMPTITVEDIRKNAIMETYKVKQ